MLQYRNRTEPYPNQRVAFDKSKDKEAWGQFLEMGLGKTKLTIDECQHLLLKGKIRALMVIAPNGVHENWVEQLEIHMPEEVLSFCYIHVWHSKKAKNKRHEHSVKALMSFRGLRVLLMSYDAVITDKGGSCAKKFLSSSTAMLVLDESTAIKTPGARRTKRILSLGPLAAYRRCLTGTPVANSPMDLYSQMKFLRPDFWGSIGCSKFPAFKAMFGVWAKGTKVVGNRVTEYPILVEFQNLGVMGDMLESLSTRQTKQEWLPKLPAKIYKKRPFEMTAFQRRVYLELRDDLLSVIDDELVTVDHAMVKLIRLQQVTSGFLGTDEGELKYLPGPNPRLQALMLELAECSGSVLIWCRYHPDIDLIVEQLGDQCTWLDGRVTGEERTARSKLFANGDVRFLVANPAAVGQGYTWLCATTHIYYTNSFNLNHRLQSEDRSHRIGQKNCVSYIDLVCNHTIDTHITKALREKRDVAATVTKDNIKEWI